MASQSSASSTAGRNLSQIVESFRSSALNFQHPADFITLLGYSVNLFAAIRICNESGAYKILAASQSPLTAQQISTQLEDAPEGSSEAEAADREEFIDRMLRAVAALNLVDEVEPHTYVANELTRTLAEPGFDQGIKELFDAALGPHSTLSHMTYWAKDEKYIAPTRGSDGPYQRARGVVGTNTFEHWVAKEPHMLSNLSALMKVIQRDRLNWSAWFPEDTLFAAGTGEEKVPFMVDVGGGLAHDLAGMAARYPDKKMKLVVEDLPSVIAETKEEKLDPRIEMVEHDFFTKQPIQGAKIYFMHKIMHDWPDADCITILTHLREAMAPDSRIFINDCILPEKGTPLLYAAFDICMFVQLGAKERSESMWHRLMSMVGGLEVKEFWQAPDLKGEGIVEVVKVG